MVTHAKLLQQNATLKKMAVKKSRIGPQNKSESIIKTTVI